MGFKKGLVLIVLYSFASSMGAPIEEDDDDFDHFSNPDDQPDGLSPDSDLVDEEKAIKATSSKSGKGISDAVLVEKLGSGELGGSFGGNLDGIRGRREKRRTNYFENYPRRKHRKALSTLHLIFG